MSVTQMKIPSYKWDEERGVVSVGRKGVEYQAIQLLYGPASMRFRRECGRLLVAALNRKARK